MAHEIPYVATATVAELRDLEAKVRGDEFRAYFLLNIVRACHRGERIMFQVRIHGRGGQGVVTAAELLSVAAFREGRHAQAFPSFGSERTGAPVVAFCRIDDRTIRLREPILAPTRSSSRTRRCCTRWTSSAGWCPTATS